MESETLLSDLASGMVVAGPGLQECWSVFTLALSYPGVMDQGRLATMVEALRRGEDYGVNELHVDLIAGELRITFLDDASRCSPEPMVALFADLLSRSQAEQP